MTITITITISEPGKLEEALRAARRAIPTLQAQQWSMVATIEAPDDLSPYELQRQLSALPGVTVRFEGEADAAQ